MIKYVLCKSMQTKFFKKIFLTIFFCFVLLTGFTATAQSQVKIISVVQSISLLGTNVNVKGQALPNSAILLSIEDAKDNFAYSIKTNSNAEGLWSANFNQSLKSGIYNIEAVIEDGNGLQVGQTVYGPIKINGSFVFIVGIFSVLVLILLSGFVGGWYINKLAEIKRYRRILMSQRDIIASYNVLKNDVNKALNNSNGAETDFLLKHISENLEKMNKYVGQGINIIGKYDIISKIDNFFKIKNKIHPVK